MNKTFIVIGREFTTRIRKRSFLILTLAVPVLLAAFYAFMMWMILKDDTQERKIAVVNRSGIDEPLSKVNNTTFEYTDTDITEAAAPSFLQTDNYYAIIRIPENVMDNPDIPVYSFSQLPMELKNEIAAQIRKKIEDIKKAAVIEESKIPDLDKKLAATRTPVIVRTLKVSADTGEARESSSEIASALGLVAGMIIYFFIFMYASQVMKGVIEEKTNRIIEVLVSSVKPFQFLMGKIIGIVTVGLLQFLIWVVFGIILIIAMQTFLLPHIDLEVLRNAGDMTGDMAGIAGNSQLNPQQLQLIQKIATTIDLSFILRFLGAFLFYFIGGYLLYASLFAAIGAAVDNETDSQQFLFPLSIILIAGLYIGFAAVRSPESPLVFWSSLIPFTSPIVMLVRIPFGVPGWELAVSMLLLIVSFVFFTWLSGRIYRVGILMYGKKVTWKELYKWLKY